MPIWDAHAIMMPVTHHVAQAVMSTPQQALSDDTMRTDSDEEASIHTTDDEKEAATHQPWTPAVYTVSRVLLSCATLRSLSLGRCLVAPPANVCLPSLVTLVLFNVYDQESEVQRLITGCPRLSDLTLEACNAVTTLSVLSGQQRLRRLALRCCHGLAAVAVDASQLQAFEYKGNVPESSLLTLHGGSGKVAYCKVDICGEEVTSKQELIKLRQLLELFPNVEHLHLESARLGSGMHRDDVFMTLPAWPRLRHLELRGRLPDDDTTAVSTVSRILGHTPNLEALSLFFHPQEHERLTPLCDYFNEEELLDAHYLRYNPYSVVTGPSAPVTCCLRSRVREINLVHYQGARAQRTLAKFILGNALLVEDLFCRFAEGPLWIQTQLMCEIKGWVVNKSANTDFA